MIKLKKRLKAAHKRLERKQRIRKRVHGVVTFAENRKLDRLKNLSGGIEERYRKAIAELHAQIQAIEKRIDELEERRENERDNFVRWLNGQVGIVEGSTTQRAWAADLGYSWTLPWCSIFAAYGLKHKGGFEGRLPTNPAYSGNWLNWSHGHRVSYSNAQPGDLLIFDWGDGGITDHVAVYVGNGTKVGGNENNRVEKDAVPTGNIVGVVRPNWDD